MVDQPPAHAQIVIIGGGIVGCSVAYHLAAMGQRDVVLLERYRLGCGTTWHSAANFTRIDPSAAYIRLINYSREVHQQLEAETGLTVGWRRTGRVQVARTRQRLESYMHIVAVGRALDLDFELIGAAEAGKRLRILRTDDLVGALWSPGDGRVNATDYLSAYARAARNRGVRIVEDAPVRGLRAKGGRIRSVVTDKGEIVCETVVNCAGIWARQVASMCGVELPLYPLEHFYLLTKPFEGIVRDMPAFRDPDGLIYGREEVGGLLLGCFETRAKPIAMADLPKDFAFSLLNEDWNQFEPYMREAIHRIPALETAEILTLINGPEAFTPDGKMIMGEAPGVRGFFTLAGMNSSGMVLAAGAGRALAEWVVDGAAGIDVTAYDIRRFAAFQGNETWLRDRIREVPSHSYGLHPATREFDTGRMQKLSPLHDRLARKGASFGAVAGWERPNWFRCSGLPLDQRACVNAEQRAARTGIAVIDQTAMGKLRLRGRDAGAALAHIAVIDPDMPLDSACVAPFLNPRGGIEALPMIVRDAAESWLILTAPGQVVRDMDWIDRHLPVGADVDLTDMTGALVDIAVQGPSVQGLLAQLVGFDLDGEMPPGQDRAEFRLAGAAVEVIRAPRSGEIHLLVEPSAAGALYDEIFRHGAGHGVRDVGHFANDALRIERAMPAWGVDIGPTVSAIEAGVLSCADLNMRARAIGLQALLDLREAEPSRKLRTFALVAEPRSRLETGAPIKSGGRYVGFTSSAAFVDNLARSVVMGLVTSSDDGAEYELDVAGESIALMVHEPGQAGDAMGPGAPARTARTPISMR